MDVSTTIIPTHQAGPSRRPSEFPGIALIIGAGSPVGRAIALSLLRNGCTKFIITDTSPSLLEYTSLSMKNYVAQSDIYTTMFLLCGSLNSQPFVDQLFYEIRTRFGRIDYAINVQSTLSVTGASSGIMNIRQAFTTGNGSSIDIGPDEASLLEKRRKEELLAAAEGLKGLWEATRREIEMMRSQQVRLREGYEGRKQRGCILNVVVGSQGAPGASDLDDSIEDTVSNFTRQDAKESSSSLIRINALLTGPLVDPDTPPELRSLDQRTGRGLGSRLRVVEEVIDSAIWLLGERASFVNGIVLGGR